MYSQFRLEALATARVQLEIDKVYWESTFPSGGTQHIDKQIAYLDSQIEVVKRNVPIELAEMSSNMARSILDGMEDLED